MIFRFTNWIKLAFVTCLRVAFSNSATPTEYLYSQTEANSNIAIYRGFPIRILKYPCLVIEALSADAKLTSLGDEEITQVVDPVTNELQSVTYAGGLQIPIKITIMAKTTTDRERLTDLVTIYTRYLFKTKFSQYGFGYTNIKIGGESQTEIDAVQIYENTVTVDIYTEFENTLPGSLFIEINKLNLEVDVLDIGE